MKSSTHFMTASMPHVKNILMIALATLPKISGEGDAPKFRTWSRWTIPLIKMARNGQADGWTGMLRKAESTLKMAASVQFGASATSK
jgi:hypothetical protein